jgi:hypothetical protein
VAQRVNLQDDNGNAQPYRLKQLIAAVDKVRGKTGEWACSLHLSGISVRRGREVDRHLHRVPKPVAPGPEPGDAVTGIRDLVEDVARDMRANGEPVPEPLSSKT